MKKIILLSIAVVALIAIVAAVSHAATPGNQSATSAVSGTVTVSNVFSLALTNLTGGLPATAPSFTGAIDGTEDVPLVAEPYGADKASIVLLAKNNHPSADLNSWRIDLKASKTSGDFDVDKLWYYVGADATGTVAYNRNTGAVVNGGAGFTRSGFVGAATTDIGYGWKAFSTTDVTLYTSQTEDVINTPYGTLIGFPIGLDQRGVSAGTVSAGFDIAFTLVATP